jgi:tRNA A-37 threonylcarbamoyl transferase component Bud32
VTEQPALPERYRLIGKLGHGGMGRVWLAEDTWLKREVALKQLITSDGETADLTARRRRRVLHEARALARVKHPAIVPIHDFFVVRRDPWIVMDYIKGQSLDKVIGRERLSERLIARIGLRVLDALVAAHKEGIVHRDVKPANILVATDGAVYLIDFGIARSDSDPSLTGIAILGTLEFLAPERLEAGAKAGPPADIWSLGVTLFYALEGYSPFRHNQPDTQAVLMAILRDTPAPTRRGPLADITLRMLDKDPERRATAQEVRRVLERLAKGQPKPSPRPEAPEPKPFPRPKPLPRSGPVSASVMAGLGEEIVIAGADKGAALLVALDVPAAARVIADCPAEERGALLQGIAATEPGTAATILRMLLADAAGRAFRDLRPKTAASLLAAMPTPEAARILSGTDRRAAASAIMELAPPQAAAQLKGMPDKKRAAEVLAYTLSSTAIAIADADPQFARLVLPYLAEPLQSQVRQAIADDA